MNLRDLFFVSQWDVAYREIGAETCFDLLSKKKRSIFKQIKDTKKYSFADPLFFSDENGNYLFVEAINKKSRKGTLGVFDFNNGLGKFHHLIEEVFHMSYPFVFKHQGEYFLMPESNNAHQLLLYRATEYPYKWEKYKVLLDGVDCVDTTIYRGEGNNETYLLTYVKSKPYNMMSVYKLNEDLTLTKIKDIVDEKQSQRGAGHFITIGEKWYRPSQYCADTYGHYLLFNQVESGCPDYQEKESFQVRPGAVRIMEVSKRLVYKIHTYSRGENYEFIDFMHRRFSPLKPLKKIIQKIKSRI